METMCIVMRGREFLSYGGDGSSKGNEKSSGFKCVAQSHRLVSERCIIHVRDHSQTGVTGDWAHSAVKVPSRDSHVVPPPIVSGGVLVSPEGPVLLCALIGLPAAAVE